MKTGRAFVTWWGAQVSILLLLTSLAGLAGAVPTTPVDEERVVQGGEYTWVLLYGGNPPRDLAIEVAWNSTVPIDVWLMDRAQWNRFDSGQTFGFDVAQSGLNGSIRFSAPAARLADGSLYVVIDNTARGNTTPPAAPADDVASVSVTGKTWHPDPEFVPNEGGFFLLRSVEVIIVLVPVAIVALLVVRRFRKKDRHEEIRRELSAGNVVGAGAPVAPEVFGEGRNTGPARPVAPQPWGQAQAPAARPGFCRSCGSPLVPGNAFCNHCGART